MPPVLGWKAELPPAAAQRVRALELVIAVSEKRLALLEAETAAPLPADPQQLARALVDREINRAEVEECRQVLAKLRAEIDRVRKGPKG